MSDTRFVAYWGRCLSNFERDFKISIEVLKIKAESESKAESRQKAGRVLKRIQGQSFMLLNLGMIDIYQELGEVSKALQKVEQFPWAILEIQKNLVQSLQERSKIKLSEEDEESRVDILDEKLWPVLKKNIKDVITCKYKGLDKTIFSSLRRRRSSDDVNTNSLSLLTTI